jgi:hypothetical protein
MVKEIKKECTSPSQNVIIRDDLPANNLGCLVTHTHTHIESSYLLINLRVLVKRGDNLSVLYVYALCVSIEAGGIHH